MSDTELNHGDASILFRSDGSVELILPACMSDDDEVPVGGALMNACIAASLHKWPDLQAEAERRFLSVVKDGPRT